MQHPTLYSVTFSPTGTSRRTAEAIARAFAAETIVAMDATLAALPAATLAHDAAALFAVPVYGGHPAPLALERIAALRGEATPAIVTVVYGNRDFERAACELAAFVAERGFVPVAAAAFVGEHSYCSETFPIAAGRPDAQDLAEAEAFGRAVRAKLDAGDRTPVDPATLPRPRIPLLRFLRFAGFVLSYRRRQKRNPSVATPIADADRCIRCGRCARLCPTGAIPPGDEVRTDPKKCIRCNACVKGCPTGARTYPTPFAAALARDYRKRQHPATLI